MVGGWWLVVGGRLLRLSIGLPLAWGVAIAAASPIPLTARIAAVAIAALTLWRPSVGLLLVAGLTPAGALFASSPARGAELLILAFLGSWLLGVWRPLSRAAWPRTVTLPALVYLAVIAGSWLVLTIGAAAGVPRPALPAFLLQSIPLDHLVFFSLESATSTLLQASTGVGLFVAAAGIARSDPRVPRGLAMALAVSTAILAVGTLGEVTRQWAEAGFTGRFLLRYVSGERFSFHLADVNAVGSLYALGALVTVALAMADRQRRVLWALLLVVMAPAAWLAGSRTSFVAFATGLLIAAGSVSKWRPTRVQKTAVAAALAVAVLAALLAADWRQDVRGTAGRAVGLRSQFTESSFRMFSSAPLYGVGIGQYFNRSAEFFTPELRTLYGNENAHNYFAQQFAELGLLGGLVFLWLVFPPLLAGWRAVRSGGIGDGALLGLFAGAAAYLLTCITGHPLLVPEASFPFWAALGVVAGTVGVPASRRMPLVATAVASLVIVAGLARTVAAYDDVAGRPGEYGFHEMEAMEDGTAFRWMTRHAVTYIPDGPGFLRLRVRAPGRSSASQRPFVLETSIAGRQVDRRELPFGEWITFDLATRRQDDVAFRRVDLGLNQFSTEAVTLGVRAAQRPIGVMVGSIAWIPLE